MKTILIVEDSEDYASNLQFVLSRAGYQAVVASDGKMGLKQAIRLRPDLILMDVLMPDQDGVETTILIREQEALKDVPIIFLTAVTASENMVVSVKGQNYPGISKMMDHEKIINRVRTCLGE